MLALPLFGMQLAFSDDGNAPTSLTTRRAYDLLATGFGPGHNGPLVVAAEVPSAGDRPVVSTLADDLRATPGVAFVTSPSFNQAGDTAVLIVSPQTSPQDLRTQSLVHRLRERGRPGRRSPGTGVKVLVGGETAAAVDSSRDFSHRLPWVIGGVVLLSFLLLMSVFRSVAVPIKAAIMNLLSIGAAYGVIVAVFQWGWLGSVVGITKTAPIDPWIPLMLFTILFGLSMDYEVFLLSRIREEWHRSGDNATSVADGLANTARVITAAAAIMVCVFGSFVIGDHPGAQGVRPRAGHGHLRRRHARPDGARAGHHGAAGQRQLVVPALARPVGAHPRRRCRGRRGSARRRAAPRSPPGSPDGGPSAVQIAACSI